jgi:hypothetical protein
MISTSVRHAIVSNRNGIDDKGHELDELDASLTRTSATTAARTDADQVHSRCAVPLIAAQ